MTGKSTFHPSEGHLERVDTSQSPRAEIVDLTRYRSVISDWDLFRQFAANPEPTVFRVCRRRVTPEELIDRLTEQGFRVRKKDGLPDFYEVEEGPRPVSLTLEHWLGLFYVQQASTGIAGPVLDPQPGERVLDLCAAPGGKTTHMAELMKDRGCLVANELNENRIRGLLGNLYRLGVSNVLVASGDGREAPEQALFDRVLVDAPCSGEGTLRRRAGRAPRQSSSFLGYVTKVQRRLLEKAIRVTKPGGTILYVTCTFAPEENEAVINGILRDHPVEIDPIKLQIPCASGLTSFEGQRYDSTLEGSIRIYPQHLDSGGLFMARLRRLEGSVGGDGLGAAEQEAEGWNAVPELFPGNDSSDVAELVGLATDDLKSRFGVSPTRLDKCKWILRGRRLWLHTMREWPVDAWETGVWRPISIGFRAVEFDSRGRPRPTNDLLRWLGHEVHSRIVDVNNTQLHQLLTQQSVPVPGDLLGPVALRRSTDTLGRGAMTRDGLKSEIPRSRAIDLARALDID